MDYEKGLKIIMDEDDLVTHVVGSSKDRGNWKAFWLKHAGRKWPDVCQIYNCGNPAQVGAHVYIKHNKSNKWCFILPTCQSCNKDSTAEWGAVDSWVSVKLGAAVVCTPLNECCFE